MVRYVKYKHKLTEIEADEKVSTNAQFCNSWRKSLKIADICGSVKIMRGHQNEFGLFLIHSLWVKFVCHSIFLFADHFFNSHEGRDLEPLA